MNKNNTLRTKAVSSVSWTAIAAVVMVIIHLIQIGVLSRILSATEFGLMSIILIIINFSNLFIDIGFSKAIIHKQKISNDHLSSLYYTNIIAGLIIFFIIWFGAPYISLFFEEPNLTELLKTVAFLFLIQPFGQQFTALLQKELKFKSIAIRNMLARFAALIVAVFTAYNGYGVYALIYGQMTYVLVGTFLIIIIGLRIHKPTLHFKLSDLKEYLNFGLFQSADQIVAFFNSQMDIILVGKFLGTADVGIYSIAKDLINKPMFLINPIITKVTFPLLAKLQNDKNKVKKIYLKIVNLISSVNFPVYAIMILLAEPIVMFVLGAKWTSSIIIFQILGFVYLLRSCGNPAGSLLQALGRPDISFSWNLSVLFILPIFIYIGSSWGILGVAVGFLTFQVLGIFPYWFFVFRRVTAMTFSEDIKSFIYPLIFSAIIMLINLPIIYYVKNLLWQTIVVSVIFSLLYIVFTLKYNREFVLELKYFLNLSPNKLLFNFVKKFIKY